MNKLQRELEGELAKAREARTALERRLDEKETEHKKSLMMLRDQHEESLDTLRKEKVWQEGALQCWEEEIKGRGTRGRERQEGQGG